MKGGKGKEKKEKKEKERERHGKQEGSLEDVKWEVTSAEDCWYQEPFVKGWYRKPLGLADCVRSLFYLHNESANVWTQILGVLVFLSILSFHTSPSLFPLLDATDTAIILFFFYSITQSFTISACAHLFCCNSPTVRARLFQCDYCAIFFSGTACHLLNAQFSPSYQTWLPYSLPLTILACVGSATYLVFDRQRQLTKELSSARYLNSMGPKIRSLVFFVTMNVTYLPLYHRVSLPDMSSRDVLLGLATPLCYILGGVFYGLHIPQRFAPGKFDLFPGQAIMHLLMVGAQTAQYAFILHCIAKSRFLPSFSS